MAHYGRDLQTVGATCASIAPSATSQRPTHLHLVRKRTSSSFLLDSGRISHKYPRAIATSVSMYSHVCVVVFPFAPRALDAPRLTRLCPSKTHSRCRSEIYGSIHHRVVLACGTSAVPPCFHERIHEPPLSAPPPPTHAPTWVCISLLVFLALVHHSFHIGRGLQNPLIARGRPCSRPARKMTP
ncbi:unnamed protein product, partial [Scytosiphon promiscuus]